VRVYSYSKARQQFAELLNRAWREGQVEIRRRDGRRFIVQPNQRGGSPLNVPGVDANLSRQEIVSLVRESQRSVERLLKLKSVARSGRKTRARTHHS
jgi:hypothetical protein